MLTHGSGAEYFEPDMNMESPGKLVDFWRQRVFPVKRSRSARPRFFGCRYLFLAVLLPGFCFPPISRAQPADTNAADVPSTNSISGTPDEQRAALQSQITNAFQSVRKIVNQPVRAYVRTANLSVSVYSPGWFHEGAIKPNFDTVDVRQSQQLIYANEPYVTSDLNPGVVFMGRDLEFNAMTKYFYTDRSIPKHRLSEAEMLEINRLYRIIGHGQAELRRMQTQVDVQAAQSNNVEGDTEPAPAPDQPLASIRSIPRQTRLLYGGIAVGALILLMVVLRLVRKKSE
jgi:hypothetical protein